MNIFTSILGKLKHFWDVLGVMKKFGENLMVNLVQFWNLRGFYGQILSEICENFDERLEL